MFRTALSEKVRSATKFATYTMSNKSQGHWQGLWVMGALQLLSISSSVSYAQVNVTLYSETNYQGNSKQLGVDRCELLTDFDDQASSLRTSGCVMLYRDQCCVGPSLQITEDTADLPTTFNKQLTSVSPCGFYRPDMPHAMRETWLGHSQTMHKMAEDEFTAVYYNEYVSGTALENHREYLEKAWAYVKSIYGSFGPEGGRLNAFIHANQSGPPYNFNSINIYFDTTSACRNLIDLVGGPTGWSTNLTGTELDVFTHEISHIVEGASKDRANSPSYGLWGDSKWAEIFIYDVYDALGMDSERDRFANQVMNGADNFPKPGTYWFKNWFYPIYSNHGGAQLLNNYFTLLAAYYPKRENGWQYIEKSINLGEFVHFFSGAASADLKPQAEIAFAWDAEDEKLLQQAKIDFPFVRY